MTQDQGPSDEERERLRAKIRDILRPFVLLALAFGAFLGGLYTVRFIAALYSFLTRGWGN